MRAWKLKLCGGALGSLIERAGNKKWLHAARAAGCAMLNERDDVTR
jgi:hypothetical protein